MYAHKKVLTETMVQIIGDYMYGLEEEYSLILSGFYAGEIDYRETNEIKRKVLALKDVLSSHIIDSEARKIICDRLESCDFLYEGYEKRSVTMNLKKFD